MLVDPQQWRSAAPVIPSLPDSLETSISTLDQEMKDILLDKTGDVHTKAQLYQQVLQRYLNLADKYRQRPLGSIEISQSSRQPTYVEPPLLKTEPSVKDYLLRNIGKTQHNKAARLLEELETIPELTWDNQNQMVYSGKTIKGSNVVDLVKDLVQEQRSTKYYTPPKGWEILTKALKSVNVPRSVIRNTKRWSAIQDAKDDKTTTWTEY